MAREDQAVRERGRMDAGSPASDVRERESEDEEPGALARALIVGCGCRGRELGTGLLATGWEVRGTSRDEPRREAIEAAGIEAAVADPDRLGTVLDLIDDVTLVAGCWARHGTARPSRRQRPPAREPAGAARRHARCAGFVYEAAGTAPGAALARAGPLVAEAAERWRIPVAVVAGRPRASRTRWREPAMTGRWPTGVAGR